MFKSVCVLIFFTLVNLSASMHNSSLHVPDAPTIEFIKDINAAQSSWTAGENFWPSSSVKNLLNVLPYKDETLPRSDVQVRKKLKTSFDGRSNWRRCRSIGKVREQGNCASAWALVAASVYSDRLCVSRRGGEVSAEYVLSCCHRCGISCLGGFLTTALSFLVETGSPAVKCLPYSIFPCQKLRGSISCATVRTVNPICHGFCRRGYPKRQPYMDLRRASGAYSIRNHSATIMSEIVSKGPVASIMDVYQDLFAYKKGVYYHTLGELVGQHPVKIVGWGHDDDRPYWIVVNSWGPLWGDEGVIKVARETNGCNLENRIFTVDP